MLPESTTQLDGLRKLNNDAFLLMKQKEVIDLQVKIIYAKDFTPYKVAYYEERLKMLTDAGYHNSMIKY